MEPLSEQDIVKRVLSGRRDDFALLVRRYQNMVISVCLAFLRGRAEAEEAAQDVFVKAYKNLGGFRFDSSFSTWLHRIARHHCLDLLKAHSARKTDSLDAIIEERGDLPPAAVAEDNPDFNAGELRGLLDELPEEYRLVLLLRETQGLTYEEIAEQTEVSVDSVKARLRRARNALREKARHFLKASGV